MCPGLTCMLLMLVISTESKIYCSCHLLFFGQAFPFPFPVIVSKIPMHGSTVIKTMDEGSEIDHWILEFSQVLSVVNRRIISTKLTALGVYDCLLTWIRNFLIARTFHVCDGNALSNEASVPNGVPLGSASCQI